MFMSRSMSKVLAALESSLASFVFLIRLNRVFLVFLAKLMAVDPPPGVLLADVTPLEPFSASFELVSGVKGT